MALKIGGTTIIDDNKNIVDVNTVTANKYLTSVIAESAVSAGVPISLNATTGKYGKTHRSVETIFSNYRIRDQLAGANTSAVSVVVNEVNPSEFMVFEANAVSGGAYDPVNGFTIANTLNLDAPNTETMNDFAFYEKRTNKYGFYKSYYLNGSYSNRLYLFDLSNNELSIFNQTNSVADSSIASATWGEPVVYSYNAGLLIKFNSTSIVWTKYFDGTNWVTVQSNLALPAAFSPDCIFESTTDRTKFKLIQSWNGSNLELTFNPANNTVSLGSVVTSAYKFNEPLKNYSRYSTCTHIPAFRISDNALCILDYSLSAAAAKFVTTREDVDNPSKFETNDLVHVYDGSNYRSSLYMDNKNTILVNLGSNQFLIAYIMFVDYDMDPGGSATINILHYNADTGKSQLVGKDFIRANTSRNFGVAGWDRVNNNIIVCYNTYEQNYNEATEFSVINLGDLSNIQYPINSFIGISQNSAPANSKVAISKANEVSDIHTGLQPGKKYYVGNLGALTTEIFCYADSDGINQSESNYIGKAISETQLLVAKSPVLLTEGDIGTKIVGNTTNVNRFFAESFWYDSSEAVANINSLAVNQFSSGNDCVINNITVGRGRGSNNLSVAIGSLALSNNSSGNNNTAIGYNTLQNNTTGYRNTGVGASTLKSNTTGRDNTAVGESSLTNSTNGFANVGVGYGSLYSNTAGTWNTSVGAESLYSNTTGDANNCLGFQALPSNTTGKNNISIGFQSLFMSVTGDGNVAVGHEALWNSNGVSNQVAIGNKALRNNTTGANNTAVGSNALITNTTGEENAAFGSRALYSNTIGYYNTAIGPVALYSNTVGESNTATGRSALFSNTTGSSNTATGVDALNNNVSGNNNAAFGVNALQLNTTGYSSTAIGFNALRNNNANFNTATGANALESNTTGVNNTALGSGALERSNASFNTATGAFALQLNTTGVSNTALGSNALGNNTVGESNTANGHRALFNNTIGSCNTVSGKSAMSSNVSGSNNSAFGMNVLFSNTTGVNNTASGVNALQSNTTGANNTALGHAALRENSSGSGNTMIGTSLLNSTLTYAPVFNCTTENNRVVVSHTGVTNAYIQVAWTVVSDARDKTNFASIPHGLEFVKQLKPTAYQFRQSRESNETNGGVRYGFKAQDIASIEPEAVIVDTTNPEKLYYNESNLIPVLVKAIQELSAEVERLKAKAE